MMHAAAATTSLLSRLRRVVSALALLTAVALVAAGPALGQTDGEGAVLATEATGIVTPVMADHLDDAITRAEEGGYEALLIEHDTPGGLATSTRDIVRSLLGAEVPVIVYVAPSGAQAASAGTFITLAAHVAVMAPGTNIGAATPVGLGGGEGESSDLETKIIEDAAANIQAIAEARDRDVEFAVETVREGRSVAVDEALEVGAIDLISSSRDALLADVDGMTLPLTVDGPEVTLATADARVDDYEMSATRRLLQALANPELAFVLLSVGTLALIYEFASPGAIIPGVAGAIMLILAFFSLSVLPSDLTGVLLLMLALALFVTELFAPGIGVFAGGGAIALVFAGLFLFQEPTGVGIDLTFLIPIALAAAVIVAIIGRFALRSLRSGKYTGHGGELVGQTGTVKQASGPTGKVMLSGGLWRARADEGELRVGDQVEVTHLDGLELVVRPAQSDQNSVSAP